MALQKKRAVNRKKEKYKKEEMNVEYIEIADIKGLLTTFPSCPICKTFMKKPFRILLDDETYVYGWICECDEKKRAKYFETNGKLSKSGKHFFPFFKKN